MNLKHYCLLAMLISTTSLLQAQHQLSGAVKDPQGKALQGATLYITDLKTGAVSDESGRYTISLLPTGTYLLQISFVGYAAQSTSLSISGNLTLDFTLSESVTPLNEIIITGVGYATDKQKSPVNVTILEGDAIHEKAATNVIDAISKLPGVSAITSGQSISKPVIRGLGYNRVLTISDGVQLVDQAWFDEFGIEVGTNSVSRFEVLKGPGSLAYGSDAIAGVVNLIPEQP